MTNVHHIILDRNELSPLSGSSSRFSYGIMDSYLHQNVQGQV